MTLPSNYHTPLPESEVQGALQRLKRAGWLRDAYRDNPAPSTLNPTTWYVSGRGFVSRHTNLEAARAIATLGIFLLDGRPAAPPLD